MHIQRAGAPEVRVRQRGESDLPEVAEFLARHHSTRVARRGVVEQPLQRPALIALREGRLVGVLTYVVDSRRCEILTLHATERQGGVGSALVAGVDRIAYDARCLMLEVVTTNDNVEALRFYQRRGFRVVAVRPGAVEASRRDLKPEIPLLGDYGIPIRDEFELARPPIAP